MRQHSDCLILAKALHVRTPFFSRASFTHALYSRKFPDIVFYRCMCEQNFLFKPQLNPDFAANKPIQASEGVRKMIRAVSVQDKDNTPVS